MYLKIKFPVMKPLPSSSMSSSIIILFFLILWSLSVSIVCQEAEESPQQQKQQQQQQPEQGTSTTINGTIIGTEEEEENIIDPLAVLGASNWTRLKPGWSLTVNDQCLYEFVFQFEHDKTLPVGDDEYKGKCEYGESVDPKIAPEDGQPYLNPRQMWDRFPPYVWATIGFNHLSVDYLPCGRRPKGYTTPQYDFSFFRVTPEYRAQTMVCEVIPDEKNAVPGEKICLNNQDESDGMKFYIVPGAMIDRIPVVNMPFSFERPDHGYGPIPHYGLRSYDQSSVPNSPRDWNDVPIFMSSYDGNLVMWQAHVPYKMISGRESQFHSNADRYFETTVETLPDTWSVHYDHKNDGDGEGGIIRFTMVGKAGICQNDFERAEEAAGGPPVFPDYDLINDRQQNNNHGGDDDGSTATNDEEDISSGSANNNNIYYNGSWIFLLGMVINISTTINVMIIAML